MRHSFSVPPSDVYVRSYLCPSSYFNKTLLHTRACARAHTRTHTNWYQLVTRKWHDVTCRKNIFLVNTSSLPQNTEVKRLGTRQTRKLRNWAKPMRQTWDSGPSGSAFQSPCSWLQCPGWGHWASSMVTGIYYSQIRPVCMVTSISNLKSKSLPFHRAGVGNSIQHWLGCNSTLGRAGLDSASPYMPCPPPFLGPCSQAWGEPPQTPLREQSANVNTWWRTQPDQSTRRILKIILKKHTEKPHQRSSEMRLVSQTSKFSTWYLKVGWRLEVSF